MRTLRFATLLSAALAFAATAHAANAAGPTDDEQQEPAAQPTAPAPTNLPPAPPSNPGQPPPETAQPQQIPTTTPPQQPAPPQQQPQVQQQPAPAQPTSTGQWVYTSQYGWIWAPYAQSYTYIPPEGTPQMYVFYPAVGWRWVVAPWVYGWGPRPYWGAWGPRYYHWYAHPWFRPPPRAWYHRYYRPTVVVHPAAPVRVRVRGHHRR